MAIGEQLPFPVGSTAFGSGLFTPSTTELTSLEGREYTVEDVNPTTKVRRSNVRRTLRVVRNSAGIALLPKMRVQLNSAGTAATGYTTYGYGQTVLQSAFPVDEYLPAAGAASNDLFYVVVEGPAIALTGATAAAAGTIAAGDVLTGQTAAASNVSTTAGRLVGVTTNTTLNSYDLLNRVGVAVSARASTQTNTDILIRVGRW